LEVILNRNLYAKCSVDASVPRQLRPTLFFPEKDGRTLMDKKEHKNKYKRIKHSMGVYCIRNSQNNKVYIGRATDLVARINRHKAELKFNSHRNKELQETWSLFGETAIEFEILDVLEHEENTLRNPNEELKVLLDMWIHNLEKAEGPTGIKYDKL
jgi:predicted GIY-YIG superfamily endonuclease